MNTADSNPDPHGAREPTGEPPDPGSRAPVPPRNPAGRLELHIPRVTFFKVFGAILLAYVACQLWSLLLLVFLALLIAVTLDPMVEWLESRGLKRWLSLLIVIGGFLALLCFGMALTIPVLFEQLGTLSQTLPILRDAVLNQFGTGSFFRETLEHIMGGPGWMEAGAWVGHFISVGGVALGGLTQMGLVLVISIYLVIDGRKTYRWLLAFFSPVIRRKIQNTSEEISKVIFAYVAGQLITSGLVMIFSFTVLSLLRVPAALVLSLLAGIFDVLPILGFFVSAIPAFLLALSVSPKTAFIVLGLYLLYHAVENYFIVPKVYGNRLRLSTLTVLLGLLAGTLLAGIPGALAALPVVASYSVIERIWLKPFLGAGVAEKHEVQKEQEFGEKA